MSVDYTLQNDVAVITMDRPARYNAIDASLSEGLVDAFGRAGDEARAAILTGAGKAFCSGADLTDLMADYETGGPDLGQALDEVFHPVIHALTECAVPTIAAVNGVAAGAGLGLALGCDLRVMAESAFLTSAFTAIGLAPDSGTTWLLPRHVGVAKALELALTNKRVTAEEALQLGLCTELVPDGETLNRAVALAGDLADMVPDALVTTRRLIRWSTSHNFYESLAAEKAEQSRLGKTPEHREGVKAFTEKRSPNFRKPQT